MVLLSCSSVVQACNICGCEGCTVANSRTIVTFIHKNIKKQMSCRDLQDKASAGGFDENFCKTEIVSRAWEKCGCYNKFGQVLTDFYAQTIPPAPAPAQGTFFAYKLYHACSLSLFLLLGNPSVGYY
jgi:hypothetical protein